MKNLQSLFEQIQSKSALSSKINSRNNSNLRIKKKTDIKSTLISRKNSNPKLTRDPYRKLIINNLRKHNTTLDDYNKHIITNIIFDEQKHIVCSFKNFLIWDESSEFFKRFYYSRESNYRIPKIAIYYSKYTLICPIYFYYIYSLVKVMKRFMKKKRKYLDQLEEQDEQEGKSIVKEQYSTLLGESVLNHKSIISSIDNQLNDNESISLSKRSNNNLSLSFNELIEKTTIYQEKETVKPLIKMQYKKIPVLTISNIKNNHRFKMPKINLQSLNRLLTENSARSQKKKSVKQIQYISDNSNTNNLLGKITSNTSMNKASMCSTVNASGTKLTCNTARKILNKDDSSSIQNNSHSNKTNMNVNVNFNINFNINILNRNSKGRNKLVLSTQKNILRHKMLIAGKEKVNGKNGNDYSKKHQLKDTISNNSNKQWLSKNRGDHMITSQSTRTSKPKIDKSSKKTIQSLSIKKQKTPKLGLDIQNLLKNKHYKKNTIPKIILKNYPLTSRTGIDKQMPSTEFLAKLINDHHQVIKSFRSQNTSKG